MCLCGKERRYERERESVGERYMRLKQEKMERSKGEFVFACVCGRERREKERERVGEIYMKRKREREWERDN